MSLEALLIGVAALVAAAAIWHWTRARAAPRPTAPSAPPPPRQRSEDHSGLHRRPSGTDIRPVDPADLAAFGEDDDDDDITVVRVEVESAPARAPIGVVLDPLVADSGAELDEPTRDHPALLTSAAAVSDIGKRRRRNDDRYLKLDAHSVYAVADGMGGHVGGHVAAQIAVDTIQSAFGEQRFEAVIKSERPLPLRAEELVRAVQSANVAIYARSREEAYLKGMGTTLVAARFAPRKERLYIAHVGDSRVYRLRDTHLTQLTTDHTLGAVTDLAEDDPAAGCLSRAVGVSPSLTIDLIVAKPQIGDVYLLCSDGLSRMVTSAEASEILGRRGPPREVAQSLVELANERGGKDNITVLVVRVERPGSSATAASA